MTSTSTPTSTKRTPAPATYPDWPDQRSDHPGRLVRVGVAAPGTGGRNPEMPSRRDAGTLRTLPDRARPSNRCPQRIDGLALHIRARDAAGAPPPPGAPAPPAVGRASGRGRGENSV